MQVIGHRGARGLFPENTLEGCARTIALGVDGIEIDVALTADGVPVVTHDPMLNPDIVRTADGWLADRSRLVHALTWQELTQYDVGRTRPGSAYAARYPAQRAIDGARIPSLAPILTLPTRFTVELKTFPAHPQWTASPERMAEAVVQAADAAGAADRIVVQSFDWRGPRHLCRLRPELAYAWLTSAETVADARIWWNGPCPADFAGSVPRAVAAEGGSTWSPEHAGLTPDLIVEARELGLRVIPWTVNEPADIDRLVDWGVDGLITDYPDIVRRIAGVACAAGSGSWH